MRVVAHVDLDCFYCAVERRLDASLRGRPLVVVQYNPTEEGGVVTRGAGDPSRRMDGGNGSAIAVSYEARGRGVRRGMRGAEARTHCPELAVVQVPTAHGKSDMEVYRAAGLEVIAMLTASVGAAGGLLEDGGGSDGGLSLPAAVVEKASVDEAYLDLTAPAAELLRRASQAGVLHSRVMAAARASHVAGEKEGLEASRLSRDAVRRGHAGQAPRDPCGGEEEEEKKKEEEEEEEEEEERRKDNEPGVGSQAGAFFARPEEAWSTGELLLACGAALVHCAREAVKAGTDGSFTLSAGVSTNKMLAKLCCGLHKPDAQTLLVPGEATRALLFPLPLDRIRGLGAGLGRAVQEGLGVRTAGDLLAVPERQVTALLGARRAQGVLALARGEDDDEVKDRAWNKSVSTGKRFAGREGQPNGPLTQGTLPEWVERLCDELAERLTLERREHGRAAGLLTVSLAWRALPSGAERSASKSGKMPPSVAAGAGASSAAAAAAETAAVDAHGLAKAALALAMRLVAEDLGPRLRVTSLFLSASNFSEVAAASAATTLGSLFEGAQMQADGRLASEADVAALVDALGMTSAEAEALLKRHASVERAANAFLHGQCQAAQDAQGARSKRRKAPPGSAPQEARHERPANKSSAAGASKSRTITSFFHSAPPPPSADTMNGERPHGPART